MSAIVAAVAFAGLAYSVYSGERAASQQRDAQRQAARQARRQESLSEQAQNKANRKKVNRQTLLERNTAAATGGAGSTLLTGAGGVGPGSLTLGRTSLLGG